MRVERDWLRTIVFGREGARRFTQDSPILPEVWLVGGVQYCADPDRRIDLLLTPHRSHTPARLAQELQRRLEASVGQPDLESAAPSNTEPPQSQGVEAEGGNEQVITRPVWTLAVSQSTVAVSLTLKELVTTVLPLTLWWQRNTKPSSDGTRGTWLMDEDQCVEVRWMRQIVGIIAACAKTPSDAPGEVDERTLWYGNAARDLNQLSKGLENGDATPDVEEAGARATVKDFNDFKRIANNATLQTLLFYYWVRLAFSLADSVDSKKETDRAARRDEEQDPPLLWSVSLNRRARPAIKLSVSSTKADAARLLFNVRCRDLTWAIVDTGIDATHRAFRRQEDDPLANPIPAAPKDDVVGVRVRRTYDFTRLRLWTTLDSHPSTGPSSLHQSQDLEQADRQFKQMRKRLRSGQSLDWPSLEPLLRVSHEVGQYERPRHDHGTHVAGILAGCETGPNDGQGMCPDINLMDLRVLDKDGKGDEFSIIAALQFIRYLNASSDQPVIHGVNLSLSLLHDVENYACGRTPICEECERLIASGVVVVAAAGNRGFERVLTGAGELDAYRAISITDPGNAEGVITVGATHRFQPHTYGVSYFSSRGPTGDGRIKPDLLAPGERIYSCQFNNEYGAKDGTSMAAPHVSGAAAMLMARHREFLGQPERIKRILMKTATDLGRERYFQGAGMLDALRALQSV